MSRTPIIMLRPWFSTTHRPALPRRSSVGNIDLLRRRKPLAGLIRPLLDIRHKSIKFSRGGYDGIVKPP